VPYGLACEVVARLSVRFLYEISLDIFHAVLPGQGKASGFLDEIRLQGMGRRFASDFASLSFSSKMRTRRFSPCVTDLAP
jgi:hypothetical protein